MCVCVCVAKPVREHLQNERGKMKEDITKMVRFKFIFSRSPDRVIYAVWGIVHDIKFYFIYLFIYFLFPQHKLTAL